MGIRIFLGNVSNTSHHHPLSTSSITVKRLARDLTCRIRTEAFAVEKLIAELGAAFLCADLGVS